MQSASQLQNPRGFELDPALADAQHHGIAYVHDGMYKHDNGRQSMPRDGYGANYGEGDSQMMEGRSDEQDDADSQAGAGGPAKKASKSSAANELEMRQLFQANKHRTLPEVATELHGNERGPQSERQRQVFAMLWYAFTQMTDLANLLTHLTGSTKFVIKEKVLFREVVSMPTMYRGAPQKE
jgi:regulatory factor X